VYLHSGETGPTEIVCDFREGKATSLGDVGVRDEGDWVGDRLGGVRRGDRASSRLLVLSTPYVEGRPWAVSPSEFRPLVAQLEALHGKGYVHGDIRCFNIAFGPDQGSCRLFDFDLGGRVVDGDDEAAGQGADRSAGALCYPAGYRQDLADGIRLGAEGQPVTKSDDWYALTSVILRCHELVCPPAAAAATEEDDGADSRADDDAAAAVSRRERVLRRFLQGERDVSRHVSRLKAYLGALEDVCQREGWRIAPTSRFAQQLVKEGFAVDPDGTDVGHRRREGRDPAPGSPKKKKLPAL
jgi:hypothetical protein